MAYSLAKPDLQSIDRFSVAYRESSRVGTVYVEREGDGMTAVAKDAVSRWDSLWMTNPPEKQAQMRENFVAAMKFQGITVVP